MFRNNPPGTTLVEGLRTRPWGSPRLWTYCCVRVQIHTAWEPRATRLQLYLQGIKTTRLRSPGCCSMPASHLLPQIRTKRTAIDCLLARITPKGRRLDRRVATAQLEVLRVLEPHAGKQRELVTVATRDLERRLGAEHQSRAETGQQGSYGSADPDRTLPVRTRDRERSQHDRCRRVEASFDQTGNLRDLGRDQLHLQRIVRGCAE